MKSRGKKKVVVINKEEIAENWCFVCKDGGDLRICDYKQCLKSYHPGCVQKDDSFLESEKKWDCAWHTCFRCHSSSYLHCYTCTKSACQLCVSASNILQVKRKYGFCKACLKLALLFEEKKDYDSDGEKVDFTDRETFEGLFMEYYVIIKKEEGFELGDIYAAKDRVKMKKIRQPESGSEEIEEEEEDDEEHISDYDDDSENENKRRRKRQRSKGHKSAKRTPVKANKKEFIGWASRSLIEFLNSIGKSTGETLSQHGVTSIVNDYVKENKLLHPEKRKMIMCDERLQSLFRKKTISRNRVYDLLEVHFAENHDESEEDELLYDSEDNNAHATPNACKRQRKLDVEKKTQKKDVENVVPQSRFASIVVENVKLVYLRRSVLEKLLEQRESFDEKVTGSFVRVKSDPCDYRSRKSQYQLLQVKGVKTVQIDENNTEIILLLSDMPKEIRMCLLSDGDFSEDLFLRFESTRLSLTLNALARKELITSEEECEDLRKKVLAGEIERPTAEDLQQKARVLHKEITKHWIRKRLAVLLNLIERANEKGWRSDLFDYLEEKKRLESPSEQERLLENVPTVIRDTYEPDSNTKDIKNDVKSDEGSPDSILPSNPSVPGDGQHGDKASDESTRHVHTPPTETKEHIPEKSASKEPQDEHSPISEPEHDNTNCIKRRLRSATEVQRNKPEVGISLSVSPTKMDDKPSKKKGLDILKIKVIDLISDDEADDEEEDSKATSNVVLSPKSNDLENETWCIKGPSGERNKTSMSILKAWSERTPYASKFEAWRENEDEDNAIGLLEAIKIAFRKK